MQETRARRAPYQFKTWHSRASGQQSENIGYTCYKSSCIVAECHGNIVKPLVMTIFLNHVVLHYMHWSSVHMRMTNSRVLNSKRSQQQNRVNYIYIYVHTNRMPLPWLYHSSSGAKERSVKNGRGCFVQRAKGQCGYSPQRHLVAEGASQNVWIIL
jgi:hypothetical protein